MSSALAHRRLSDRGERGTSAPAQVGTAPEQVGSVAASCGAAQARGGDTHSCPCHPPLPSFIHSFIHQIFIVSGAILGVVDIAVNKFSAEIEQ